ncbi:MAG: hypothetical protein AB1324_01325 [Candidatus Micrarchaeota archaeon]
MKLKHDSERGKERRGILPRLREAAAIFALAAVFSCSKEAPGNMPVNNAGASAPSVQPASATQTPSGSAPQGSFDFGPAAPINNQAYCSAFPEIEQFSSRRNLEPMLVRAFVLTESGFDACSSAKVCSRAAIQSGSVSGCFPADPSGNSAGYAAGFDEMHDPAGACSFQNASPSPVPAWRWLGTGLMQTVEPPFTYWPAASHPSGTNGPLNNVFARSPLSSMNLADAQSCDPAFNPFNPGHSVCLGTIKMRNAINAATLFINTHRQMLGWPASDAERDRLFSMYVAGNMYDGVWNSSSRNSSHPRCSSAIPNGECWTYGFSMSRVVDSAYCSSGNGQQDAERCSSGAPRVEPPARCYGYTDFVRYVRDCELPFLPRQADPGAMKMRAYLGIVQGCSRPPSVP